MSSGDWRVVGTLYESSTTRVDRVRNDRGETRIRKTLRRPADSPAERSRYQHEYNVNRGLDTPRVVAAIARLDGEAFGIDFRDGNAQPLHDLLAARIAAGRTAAGQFVATAQHLDWALQVGAQLADALARLHDQGYVHRDVAPANVVIDANGFLQLVDLSSAAPIGTVQRLPMPLGTLPYLPPEQTGRIDSRVDPRADLYGLGVVLFELCTGELPFEARDIASWIRAHLAEAPRDALALAPGIGADLAALLARLLAKLPQQRYANADDVREALLRIARGRASSDDSAGDPTRFEAMRPAPSARLIEREREFAFFRDEWQHVRAHEPSVIVVQGAPGSGRSTLLDEVRAGWQAEGALWCRVDASSDAAELQALLLALARSATRQMLGRSAQALRQWDERLHAALEDRLALLLPWIDELGLLPRGRRLGAPQTTARTSLVMARDGRLRQADRLLTPDVLRAFFASIAPQPLVLQIDDAELWSGATAAAALACLPTTGLCLVLTTSEPLIDSAPAFEPVAPLAEHADLIALALARSPRGHVRALPPLSLAGARDWFGELLHPMSGSHLDQLVGVLHFGCGGNPRRMLDAIDHLRRHRVIGWVDGRFELDRAALQAMESDLLAGTAVGDYFATLGDEPRRVLGYAACIGSPIDLALLADVLGSSPSAVLDALRDPLACGVLRRDTGNPTIVSQATLAFTRRELEQQALATLSRNERRACHDRAAEALLRAGQAADLPAGPPRRLSPRALRLDGPRTLRLAHHLNESIDLEHGLPPPADARRRARFNLRAGELAQRGGMHRLAYRHFRFGLLLARSAPESAVVRALARGATFSSWLLGDREQTARSAHELLGLDIAEPLAKAEDALLVRQCTDGALGGFPVLSASRPPASSARRERARHARLLRAQPSLSETPRRRRLLAAAALHALEVNPGYAVAAAQELLTEQDVVDSATRAAIAIVAWHDARRAPSATRALALVAADCPDLDARARLLWFGWVAPVIDTATTHLERLLDATRLALALADITAVRLGSTALAANAFFSDLSLRLHAGLLTGLQRDLADATALPGADTLGHYLAANAALRAGTAVRWDPTERLTELARLHRDALALLLALLHDDAAQLTTLAAQTAAPQGQAAAHAIAPIHTALRRMAQARLRLPSRDRQPVPVALRALVDGERARARGALGAAARAWRRAADSDLPLPLRVLAASRAATLPGPGRLERARHAGVLRERWGLPRLGQDVTVSPNIETTATADSPVGGLLPALFALGDALEPRAVADTAAREALRLTGSLGAWVFVRSQDASDVAGTQAESRDELTMLAAAQPPAAPPLTPPWELLRYVVRSGRALDPGSATELGTSSALLLPIRDHVGVGSAAMATHEPVRGVLALLVPSSEHAHSGDAGLRLLVTQLGVALRNARLHQSLIQARDEYRALFEAAREGLIETTPSGRLLRGNSTLAHMLGFPNPTVLLAERPALTQLFVDQDDAGARIAGLLARGGGSCEAEALRRDGSRVAVEIAVRALTDRGAATGDEVDAAGTLACALLDITDRKQREAAERERLQASAAAEARSEFLAHISHEIRTPLNAIVGASELANRAQEPARVRELLRAVDAAARQLHALVDDVLDTARLDGGALQLEQLPVDVHALLDECVVLFAPRAAERGVRIVADLAAQQDAWCEGDPLRLRQVLHNLVGNAVKFTHQGDIVVRARFDDEAHELRLEVADTGIGIDADTAQRLFQPFVQADAGIARRYGGSGLGLTIVARLIALMQGELQLDSTPGKGSTFSCRLPLRRPAERPSLLRIDGLRVLLVDDNPLNRAVADALLRDIGAEPTLVASGHAALERLASEPFDLVLLDIHMPELDGFATAELAHQRLATPPPIVALSADTTMAARERAERAGFVDYLPKPLEPARLASLLARLLPERVSTVTSTALVPVAADDAVSTALSDVAEFDLALALRRHGGNRQLLDRLLAEFGAHYDSAPQTLRELLASARVEEATRLVHNLKSVSASFGGERLSSSAARLEAQLRDAAATTPAADQPVEPQLLDEFGAAHAAFVAQLAAHRAAAPPSSPH